MTTKAQRDEAVRQGAERRLAKTDCVCGDLEATHVRHSQPRRCLEPGCDCPGYKEAT